MRKRTIALTAASAALAGVVAMAPAASAEPNPPGCEKGYFCVYSGQNQTGTLVVKTFGDWSGSAGGRSTFNNGVAAPGADHIQLTYTYHGATYERCLHFNPGPGDYKLNFDTGVVFKSAVWRGEC
ncbi:peptidase inhibitor family I36 protein [Streptomyces geranii]|uniref:peptidase inhibitor family I36 protein n=1 Tax=Streptomyces geranii TaxID=2058923 RepID=UPI000D028957|nr:peptidase inhibitor family I36 protein [Streptomyces geranii]